MHFSGTLQELASTASPLLLILSLRVTPSLTYVLFTRRLLKLAKFAGVSALAPLPIVTAVIFGPALLHVAAGLAYYCACACALHAAIPWIRARLITPAALFVVNVLVFLLLPALALPSSITAAFLLLGFELVFSTYSYCIERSATTAPPDLRECLFFVFVDPTLAYTERSKRRGDARIDGLGLARMLWGLFGMVITITVLVRWKSAFEPAEGLSVFELNGLSAFALFAIVRFLFAYVQQSALATFQIGLMRQLGYETPESFRYPFLAASPADFWRRWNIFLGNWIRRYVYFPLTLRIGHAWRVTRPDLAKAIGVVGAFAVVGLAHSGYAYTASFAVDPHWIAWFTFHGVLVVVWIAVPRFFAHLGLEVSGVGVRLAVRSLSRVCFLGVLGFSAGYWSVV
jgi:hypothetical protein